MSFIHRNRLWLLPMLGVGCLWGVWNSYSAIFRPKKTAKKADVAAPVAGNAPVAPSPAGPSVSAPTPAPTLAPTPTPAPFAPALSSQSPSDVRALEMAPPELNNREALIKAGERSLDAKWLQSPESPVLQFPLWPQLFSAPSPAPSIVLATSRPTGIVANAPGALAPDLDFVIEHQDTGRREAWFAGQAFREGESPDGIHRIFQITAQGVWINGPTGRRFIPTGEEGRTTKAKSVSEPGPSMPLEVK